MSLFQKMKKKFFAEQFLFFLFFFFSNKNLRFCVLKNIE